MDDEARSKTVGGGDIGTKVEQVVLTIGKEETPNVSASKDSETYVATRSMPSSPLQESNPMSLPSPEISRDSPTLNKPPKIPTNNEPVIRRRSLKRLGASKPQSRFGDQTFGAIDANTFEEKTLKDALLQGSPVSSVNMRTNSAASKTAVEDDDLEEEQVERIYKTVELRNGKRRQLKVKALIELGVFFCLLACLISSFTVGKLQTTTIWEVEFWKWCVLVMVTFSGTFVTNWFMHIIVLVIETNFLLRNKVLYFVHGLKKSVQVFIWIALVLLCWALLFNQGVKRSKVAMKILNYVTWTLISLLIGAFLWLVKTLLLKILASNFHVKTFFDRIQESVFHHYVLQTLSGPPLIEEAERVGREPSAGQFSFRVNKKGKGIKEMKIIDMGRIPRMKQEKVSAWTMKVLVDAVTKSGLSTISNTLEQSVNGGEHTDTEITNEMEAIAAAYRIFRNVAQPGSKYIEEEDLLRFMIKEEVDLIFPMFKGSETGRIDRKALTDWVVKVYQGRKALAHALSDTKTAVRQLNKLVTGVLVVVTIIIWLLLMGIASTKVLVFLSSQLVLAAFMFGNTCKNIFEAIIFVFVMHPFDVGDRCVVDGVQLLVEEMNILSTVFLKLNNEKVYYPNSVLATKPITNYYRSPDMGDTVEFSIDFATPAEKIGLLKEKIKKYLESNPQHWHPNHNVIVKEIENVNKLSLAVYCNHTMNFQEWGDKNQHRSALVMELKRILEDLNIHYYLLTQQVHLAYVEAQNQVM